MSYSAFAEFYDSLTFNVEYERRAEYIRQLLLKNGCGGGILLDLACGTGRLSREMAKFGFDMILVDSSPEMLSFARERNPSSLILCQDMTSLDLYGTVNGAVCSLDSVNHLLTSSDVKKTFELVSLFTEPGGAFVFDVNTEFKHEKILGDNTFVYENDGVYCVWQNSYRKKRTTTDINLDIFVSDGGKYERRRESFSERAYPLDKIECWLAGAGFQVTGIYDDMTFDTVSETTQRAYFSAKKI